MTSPSDLALADRLARFLVDREPWMADAACRGLGHSAFLPSQGSSTELAYKTCVTCPVVDQCRDYQARTGSVGVWGGKYFPHPTTPRVTDARPVSVNARPRQKGSGVHPRDRKPS